MCIYFEGVEENSVTKTRGASVEHIPSRIRYTYSADNFGKRFKLHNDHFVIKLNPGRTYLFIPRFNRYEVGGAVSYEYMHVYSALVNHFTSANSLYHIQSHSEYRIDHPFRRNEKKICSDSRIKPSKKKKGKLFFKNLDC